MLLHPNGEGGIREIRSTGKRGGDKPLCPNSARMMPRCSRERAHPAFAVQRHGHSRHHRRRRHDRRIGTARGIIALVAMTLMRILDQWCYG